MRCENCGIRTTDPICASCLHHKKKEALRAAKEESGPGDAPPAPPKPPDMDALRERLRRVQEGLAEQ